MASQSRSSSGNSLISVILRSLSSDPALVLNLLFDLYQRLPLFKTLPGMYQVLEYETLLELKDRGKLAIFTKRQHVRFLQDNIIAFQDKAWGDGDIFADYRCSPGVEVDRYRDGHRYNILISLRETKQRGDETTFHIQRKIRNGFTKSVEEFQTDIDHRTHRLKLKLIFPKNRLPTRVTVITQNTRSSRDLGNSNRHILPDGRHQYVWTTKSPKLFEAYILRWEW